MPAVIEIAATPAEALVIEADAYAVIDCLRATTTIAALFGAGLRRLWVVSDIGDARRRAEERSALLFGEVGGLPPGGFDYGNSPVEAARAPVRGREAVLFTTNGTVALTSLAGRGAVFAAAPANASAVLAALEPFERVAFVCAGAAKGTRFALEDFASAAYFVQRGHALWGHARPGDLALLGLGTPDPLSLIGMGHHADAVRSVGLPGDVDFCALADTSSSVPRITAHGPGYAMLEDAL
ncbi:MAG TPA: 2-phosphosulfolactate phosphatase [Tepidiformaceae bacterium]|nr:2-phosphosulfolactate phosphatase [Tepidiformaceae bacterium]